MTKLPHAESAESIAVREMMTPVLHEALEKAIEGLSSRQRTIFTAHFLDGAPYAQLANEFGITEKNVGNIINNAKSRLRSVTSLRQYLDMI